MSEHIVNIHLTNNGYVAGCACGWRSSIAYGIYMSNYIQKIAMGHYYEKVQGKPQNRSGGVDYV